MRPRRLGHARSVPRSPLALGRLPDAPTVTYQALEGHWWLWSPCRQCGGVALPVSDPQAARAPGADACPGCETHRRRLQPAGPDPTVWYDTWLEDWVVRLPCQSLAEGVLMPMEMRWFDAAWSEIVRTAADIAFGADA
jgi:hypothetical protein